MVYHAPESRRTATVSVTTNGHDSGHTPTTDQSTSSSEVDEGYKALQVRPSTHALVRAAASRLDRSADAIVLAGVLLVNAKTSNERAQKDSDWAKSLGGAQ
jgi:hypothetical protein